MKTLEGFKKTYLVLGALAALALFACPQPKGTGGGGGGGSGGGSSTGGGSATGGGTGGGSGGGQAVSCPLCTAKGMVCMGTDGGCALCTSDSECASSHDPFGHCQREDTTSTTFGFCVQCSSTVACPTGEICDVAGIADPGTMASTRAPNVCYPDCRTANQCQPGASYCDSTTGLCLYGCQSTANNCAAVGQVCDTDAGLCVQCLSPSDCPADQSGCVDQHCGACFGSTDCSLGQQCDTHHDICVCAGSAQCGGIAPDCYFKSGFNYFDAGTADGGPIAELLCGCVVDAGTCGTNRLCVAGLGPKAAGECVTRCEVDGGPNCVAKKLVCDPVSGLCGPCTRDPECDQNPAGLICALDGGSTGSCTCKEGSPGTCPAGLVCNPPLGCTTSCVTDAGICGGKICNVSTGACHECLADTDCAKSHAGLLCDNMGTKATDTCQCNNFGDCLDADAGCNSAFHLCGTCTLPTDCPDTARGCNGVTFNCGSCVYDTDCTMDGGADGGHCSDAGSCQ